MYRILLVDDEDGVRTLISGFLRRNGHEVVEAPSGRAALRILQTELIDVVISDINMPDVDGLEVIRSVRELQPGLPVVAVTGGGMIPGSVLLKTAQAMGAMRTLEKPFGLQELLESVEGVVAEAARVT
jgi:DNA-binding NtrC family response regulator